MNRGLPVDYSARLAIWRGLGWIELPDAEYDVVWEEFRRRFGFFGTGIRAPEPSLTWDIRQAFGSGRDHFERLSADLNLKVLKALQACTAAGESVYALDWNHTCFHFNPRGGVTTGHADEWAVPVLPNGDHYVFLAEDYRFGIIATMDTSVCVFGADLLNALASDPPAVFTRLAR